MTLRQILKHKQNNQTVKVAGQDGKVISIDWRANKVTVALLDGTSVIVHFMQVDTEWVNN